MTGEGFFMRSLGDWTAHLCARARRLFSVAAVTALVLAGAAATGTAPAAAGAATSARARPAAPPVSPNEPTASQNNLRDGWDRHEPALTQSAVQFGQFGKIFKTSVDGQVYAQPLIIGNRLIVVTENDWVYGLNTTT